MRHKIIRVSHATASEVALNLTRLEDDDGSDAVVISAWHTDDDGDPFYQSKTVLLPSFGLCERFIDDFSDDSAEFFVDEFNL